MSAIPITAVDTLGEDHRAALLAHAADAIAHTLTTGAVRLPDPAAVDPVLARDAAVFVTLERDGQLLGCVGTLEAREPLVVATAYHAVGAAFADPRVPPITVDDYVAMSVKVSVLSPSHGLQVTSVHELAEVVRPGVDGLVLDAPGHRSTLLPSVWRQLPEIGDFLDALWRKAGLRPGAWPAGARVRRYTTEEFGSTGPRQRPPVKGTFSAPRASP